MIKDEEIEELKKHLDSYGKLVITDDLSESQKERFQFINSLNVDLLTVLNRKVEYDDENDVELPSNNIEDNDEDYEVEVLDNDIEIEENDQAVDGLDNFF